MYKDTDRSTDIRHIDFQVSNDTQSSISWEAHNDLSIFYYTQHNKCTSRGPNLTHNTTIRNDSKQQRYLTETGKTRT